MVLGAERWVSAYGSSSMLTLTHHLEHFLLTSNN